MAVAMPVAAIGPIRRPFALANLLGVALPAVLIALPSLSFFATTAPYAFTLASLLSLTGLYLYEAAFVRAGQLPPLS